MVHFYRGEMYRSQIWRSRLDTTTNWAVLTTGAMVSFAFGDPSHHHATLLLANLLLTVFLCHEARRFRYFSVYRARVRMLEENFFLPIITRELISPMERWRRSIAEDLDRPKFKTTFFEAIGFRLQRNYLWIYLILMTAWVVKLSIHPTGAASAGEIYARMSIGPLPSWVMLVLGAGFVVLMIAALVAWHRRGVPVDEIKGLERDLAHWKT